MPLLLIVPTAQREFARTDRFVVFFRIYQGTARQDPLVQLQSTIVDARGTVVASDTSRVDAGQFAPGRTARPLPHHPARDARAGGLPPKSRDDTGRPLRGAMRFVVRQ